MDTVQRQKFRNTLCWSCRNAVGYCSWSQSFKPVDGWQAIPTKVKTAGDTFVVISCPCYIKDSERDGQTRLKKG